MIQQGSILQVLDNSGIKKVKCIKVLGGSKKRYGNLGDLIKVSIISSKSKKNKKGNVLNSIIVNTKYRIYREVEGIVIRFFQNSVVTLDENFEMIGTRIINPIPKEISNIKNGNYKFIKKIISLAPEVV
ncbi:uL14 family ribosomal protein [Candidatus Vidania fulgoroideorum]